MSVSGLLETRSNALVIGGCPRPETGFKGLIDSVSRHSNDIVIISYLRSGTGFKSLIDSVSRHSNDIVIISYLRSGSRPNIESKYMYLV